jgi:hypothetical protein
MTHRARSRFSISFTLAYTEVCDWVRDGEGLLPRPSPETFRLADNHARRIGDGWLQNRIRAAQSEDADRDHTPTPRRPGGSPEAFRVSEALAEYARRAYGLPYSLRGSDLTEPISQVTLDHQVDELLAELLSPEGNGR